MITFLKNGMRRVAAIVVCVCVSAVPVFAFDAAGDAANAAVASIAPVSTASEAEGTVLSAKQVDAAAQAAADAAAVKAAEEEAARRALLTYKPVYGSTVDYSSAKGVNEIVQANGRSLGQYKLTFYCPCSSCSGGWGSSTSSGARTTEGRTIAVDPRKIPIGSRVFIEGFGDFIAEDVGGAIKGNRIDVFVNSHSRCYSLGVKYANVYVMN